MPNTRFFLVFLMALAAFPVFSQTEKPNPGNHFTVERISPELFIVQPEGQYFADFGKDAFGTLELSYQVKKECTLEIRRGEKLLDGRIDRTPGGTIRYQEVKMKPMRT